MNELGYGQKAQKARPTGPAQPAVGRPGNISRPTATRQAWLCRPSQDRTGTESDRTNIFWIVDFALSVHNFFYLKNKTVLMV